MNTVMSAPAAEAGRYETSAMKIRVAADKIVEIVAEMLGYSSFA